MPAPQLAQVLRVALPAVRVALPLLRLLPCVLRTVSPCLLRGVWLAKQAGAPALGVRLLAGIYAGFARLYLAMLDGVVTLEERRAVVGAVLALELTGYGLWVQLRRHLTGPEPVGKPFGRAKRKRSRTRHKRKRETC